MEVGVISKSSPFMDPQSYFPVFTSFQKMNLQVRETGKASRASTELLLLFLYPFIFCLQDFHHRLLILLSSALYSKGYLQYLMWDFYVVCGGKMFLGQLEHQYCLKHKCTSSTSILYMIGTLSSLRSHPNAHILS